MKILSKQIINIKDNEIKKLIEENKKIKEEIQNLKNIINNIWYYFENKYKYIYCFWDVYKYIIIILIKNIIFNLEYQDDNFKSQISLENNKYILLKILY